MLTTRLICVVESSDAHRASFQQLVDRYLPDYPVQVFSSGQLFLDELSQMSRFPSLILMDQRMLELEGYQTLVTLKQNPTCCLLPVVIMSYNPNTIDINSLYDLGVNSYLAKELDAPSFKETLSNLCHYWLDFNQLPISR